MMFVAEIALMEDADYLSSFTTYRYDSALLKRFRFCLGKVSEAGSWQQAMRWRLACGACSHSH